eukprot:187205-Prymnesium_polylepis.1
MAYGKDMAVVGGHSLESPVGHQRFCARRHAVRLFRGGFASLARAVEAAHHLQLVGRAQRAGGMVRRELADVHNLGCPVVLPAKVVEFEGHGEVAVLLFEH